MQLRTQSSLIARVPMGAGLCVSVARVASGCPPCGLARGVSLCRCGRMPLEVARCRVRREAAMCTPRRSDPTPR
eukprot:954227-Prymnesium_polylepis.1